MFLYAHLPGLKLWLWWAITRPKISLLCIPPLGLKPEFWRTSQAALQQRFVPDSRALIDAIDLPLPESHCFSSVPCPLVPELGLGPTMLLHLAHWARNTAFHLVIQEPMLLLCPASGTCITSASPIDQESNPTVDLSTLALQTVTVVYPCSRTKELLQFCKYLVWGPWLCCCSWVPVCQICP